MIYSSSQTGQWRRWQPGCAWTTYRRSTWLSSSVQRPNIWRTTENTLILLTSNYIHFSKYKVLIVTNHIHSSDRGLQTVPTCATTELHACYASCQVNLNLVW